MARHWDKSLFVRFSTEERGMNPYTLTPYAQRGIGVVALLRAADFVVTFNNARPLRPNKCRVSCPRIDREKSVLILPRYTPPANTKRLASEAQELLAGDRHAECAAIVKLC